MRTNEERKNLIDIRTKELRLYKLEKKRRRIMFCTGSGGVAICICILFSLCGTIPEVVTLLQGKALSPLHGTATLFGGSEDFGYVLIAVLAFLLGACFTLLLYALRKKLESTQNITNIEKRENSEKIPKGENRKDMDMDDIKGE